MRRPRRWRWLLGMAALFLLGPLAAWLWFREQAEPARLETFLPDRLGFALNLSDMRQAWERHWLSRPVDPARKAPPRPEDALRALLDALEKWEKWQEKYGAAGAELRLQLYQSTLFQALGSEAWLIFGDWQGEAGATGGSPAGLLVLLRSDSAVKRQVGPLMDLAIGSYSLERTRVEGYSVYTYRGKREGRAFSFCQVGGWICASLRQEGLGPLPIVLRRLRQEAAGQAGPAAGELQATRALVAGLQQAAQHQRSAFSAVVQPEVALGQVRQFYTQRERKISRKRAESFVYWEQRMQGIEQMTLLQQGESLFDLDLQATGPRAIELATMLKGDAATTATTTATQTTAARALLGEPVAEIMQLDLHVALARNLAPLAGQSWDAWLEDTDKLEKWVPSLIQFARRELVESMEPDTGRLGLAVFGGASPLLPGLLAWRGADADGDAALAPAQYWRTQADAAPTSPSLAQAFWVLPAAQAAAADAASTETLGRTQWLEWARAQWNPDANPLAPGAQAAPPAGFVTMNFRELNGTLGRVPAALLKKKAQRSLARWRRTLQACDMAVGGAALRIDSEATGVHVRLRTP